MRSLTVLLRFFKPLNLLASSLVFILGTGLARYLGDGPNARMFWLGLAWVVLVQLGGQFLYEYQHNSEPVQQAPSNESGISFQNKILFAAFACMSAAASLAILIVIVNSRSALSQLFPVSYLLMLALFLGAVFYSMPPLRLEVSGYGELLLAILLGFVVPAFAFTLQAQTLHRLVPMVTFPLVLMALAMLIAFEMHPYSQDLKKGRLTLMIRMGWNAAINLHNLLILSAYLLLSLAAVLGLPRFAALAAFLSLPIGLLQIWQMRQIVQGKPPNWRALEINSAACFAALAYLFSYAFWTH